MLPVVTFKDIPVSEAIEIHIKDRAQKLTQFYQRITSCRVVVSVAQKHKHQGKLFSVKIDLIVPGKELVASHKKDEDVYVAIRDAFHAIERQLEKYVRIRRGDVKVHDSIHRGYIIRIFRDDRYGFIRDVEGNEFYFTDANVSNSQFSHLEIGDLVEFIGLTAGEGLQANHVTLEKHVVFGEDKPY